MALASGGGSGPTVAADVIVYQTDFERPEFNAGPLGGQGGWLTPFGPADATRVVSGSPEAGGQFVQFDTSAITGPPILVASMPLGYDPVAAGFSRISAQADVAFDAVTSNSGLNFELSSVGDRPLLFGAMAVLADGTVQAFNTDGGFLSTAPGALPLGSFGTLRIDLDFITRAATFSLDGVSLGNLAFDQDASNILRDVTLLTGLNPPFTTPSSDLWSFDNLSVTAAVPEPSSLTLALLGATLLGVTRRRLCREGIRRP